MSEMTEVQYGTCSRDDPVLDTWILEMCDHPLSGVGVAVTYATVGGGKRAVCPAQSFES